MAIDILLLNLTRFGDLLQSQALLADCQRAGLRAGIVCLDNFATALPLLRHLAGSWALPGGMLLRCLDGQGPGGSWHEAPTRLLEWVARVRREAAPRHVVNLTATLPARLLASLLAPAPEAITGFALDAAGYGFCRGGWAAYLCGSTLQRGNAPFNMQDMFRMAARPALRALTDGNPPSLTAGGGDLCAPSADALREAERLLAAAPAGCAGFVGLQLGASNPQRQWPEAFFAEVGDGLWQAVGLCPVLLGSRAEQPLARAYAAQARAPFVDAVGATSLPVLAALVSRLRLLITNDTGTMHLASGLGVPSLALFLATAQAWDTGPYLPDCCCLEPALPCHPCGFRRACSHDGACRTRIGAPGVLRLALARLESGSWEAGVDDELRRAARVWRTGRDADGFADLFCLSGHELTDRSLWLRVQRPFWRNLLDGMDGGPQQEDPLAALPEAVRAACRTSALAETVHPPLTEAQALAARLPELCRLAPGHPRMGQLLLRSCDQLQRVLEGCEQLTSLAYFWREIRQARGGELERLAGFCEDLAANIHRLGTLFAA